MAPRRKYGQTWWGQAWLRALEYVPDANRLARGRTYYNAGRVFNVEFDADKLKLEALVEGSAYVPYEVVFRFDPLPAADKVRLIDALSNDSALVARILDGELPGEVLDVCREHRIALFPRSWRDLHPSCSCPDSSAFCKHLAALFYLLLDRIDADPFMVFLTRGVDLKKELRSRGVNLDEAVQTQPLALDVFWQQISRDGDLAEKRSDDEALQVLRSVDYSRLADMRPTLERLVPERFRPLDPPGFQAFILRLVRRAAQAAQKPFQSPLLMHTPDNARRLLATVVRDAPDALQPLDLVPCLTMGTGIDPVIALREHIPSARGRSARVRIDPETAPLAVACRLIALPATVVRRLRPEAECIRTMAVVAGFLLQNACVAPTPVSLDGAVRLWWLPALREPSVRALVDHLSIGISPWAVSMAGDAFPVAPEAPGFARAVVVAALTALTNAAVKSLRAWDEKPTDPGRILASQHEDVARITAGAARALGNLAARAFRAFLLADAHPWRPTVSAATHADGVKINFGLLARKGVDGPYSLSRPVLLKRLLTDERFANDRFAALNVLSTLVEACPLLERIQKTRGRPVTLTSSELKDFVFETAPVLTMLGVTLSLPLSLKRILRPTLVGRVSLNPDAGSKSLLGRDAVGHFVWEAALGGRTLTPEDIEELRRHAGGIVRMGEDYVFIDPEELAKLTRMLDKQPQPTYLERMRAVLAGEHEGVPVFATDDLKERLAALSNIPDMTPPASLTATLRPYQARGYSWLVKNLRLGLGALIADDMGLGKTLQVIAALTFLKEKGELEQTSVIAVVPTGLLTNWTREIAKFSPSLTVSVYHGNQRELPPQEALPDVVLTSYGTLRRDAELIASRHWRLLVLDEAQALKNADTAQSVAVRSLGVKQVIAMSGTPVENRLSEYWSILQAVQPGLLGSAEDFVRTFASPIESNHDMRAAQAFKRLTAPFMLRRLKSDKSIIADLPDRLTIDRFTTLTPEQAVLYSDTLEKLMKKIAKLEGKDAEETRMARRGAVLKLITALKQICNSPSQFLKTEAPHPDSGKAAALFEILENCRDADRKTLIFTQYREMGERLQHWIEEAMGEKADFLHGGVPVKKRQEMVDRFQTDRSVGILIVSLKAGGTGLNLTAASCVIHYDLWWNPAVEAQATDRAYRIGQRRDVLVYRFVTAGTFEERINAMLEAKRGLADMTVATGETWIGDLPAAELEELLRLQEGV